MIKVRCAKCGKTLNIPDQFAGKKGKCPGCQEMLTIPAASAGVSAVAPAPPKTRKSAPPAPVEEVEEAQEVEEEPAEEVEAEEEERIADRPASMRSRPARDEDEERVARQPARKRSRSVEADEDDAPRQRKRRKSGGEWAECPNCGATDATRVRWTFWGGLIGPMIINTVRCNDCGTKYNGIHGDSNTTRIVIYFVVNTLIGLVLIGVAVAAAVAFNSITPSRPPKTEWTTPAKNPKK